MYFYLILLAASEPVQQGSTNIKSNYDDLYLGGEVLTMDETKNCRRMVRGDLSKHSHLKTPLFQGTGPM